MYLSTLYTSSIFIMVQAKLRAQKFSGCLIITQDDVRYVRPVFPFPRSTPLHHSLSTSSGDGEITHSAAECADITFFRHQHFLRGLVQSFSLLRHRLPHPKCEKSSLESRIFSRAPCQLIDHYLAYTVYNQSKTSSHIGDEVLEALPNCTAMHCQCV